MKKEWKDFTGFYSGESKFGKCLLGYYVLDNAVEVRLYKVVESGFDYRYEIFVHFSKLCYGSIYLDKEPYKLMEEMKKDIYEESFKKNRYSRKFTDDLSRKYHIQDISTNDPSLFDRCINSELSSFWEISQDLDEDYFDDGISDDDDDMAFDDPE